MENQIENNLKNLKATWTDFQKNIPFYLGCTIIISIIGFKIRWLGFVLWGILGVITLIDAFNNLIYFLYNLFVLFTIPFIILKALIRSQFKIKKDECFKIIAEIIKKIIPNEFSHWLIVIIRLISTLIYFALNFWLYLHFFKESFPLL